MALRKFTATGLAVVATSFVSVSAMAAPVVYNYSTGAALTSSNLTVLGLLGGGSISVSGSFTYDSATPFTVMSQAIGYEPGRAIYSGAVSQLSGSVNGRSFIDNGTGVATVGNEVVAPYGLDWFSLNADPTPRLGENTTPAEYAHQLAGFTVGDYKLDNVRLYWVEGYYGVPDYLSNNNLLPTVPSFNGFLALDFILASDPTNTANSPYYSRTVYFSGLKAVAAVPEPGAIAMGLAGVAGVLGAMRRRKDEVAKG